MMTINSIDNLISALCKLPGVGPKTARRLTYHLLERDRPAASKIAEALIHAVANVGHCKRCRTLSETELCTICTNPKRNTSLLCVVETPTDAYAIELTHSFQGLYFVLGGHLSPLDGIGPNEIGINKLKDRLQDVTISEIILATNSTIEGEATAHYIANMVSGKNIKCTRLAHGIPMGGELEYLDGNTLARAFLGRQIVEDI